MRDMSMSKCSCLWFCGSENNRSSSACSYPERSEIKGCETAGQTGRLKFKLILYQLNQTVWGPLFSLTVGDEIYFKIFMYGVKTSLIKSNQRYFYSFGFTNNKTE